MEVEAVDGFDLVSGFNAGAGSGKLLLAGEAQDLHGRGLHLGDEAEAIKREVFSVALVLDGEAGVGASAFVDEGERDGAIEIEE